MSKNLYDVLGVNKSSNTEEIKKAYRKQAMKYHPDRNKDDKTAETKFKEINEAYGVLGDEKKKKNYDMFGSTSKTNPFGGSTGAQASQGGGTYSGFEDIFSNFGGQSNGAGATFDFSDMFGDAPSFGGTRKTSQGQQESLDREIVYEVPIFDIILGCRIELIGVNKKKVKLKIPANTKPGTKFRVKGLGSTRGGTTGNLIVKIEAKMPKSISEVDKNMLEKISENVGY